MNYPLQRPTLVGLAAAVWLLLSQTTGLMAQTYKGFQVGRYEGQVANKPGTGTGKATLDIRSIDASGNVRVHLRDSDGLEGEGDLSGTINVNGVMQLSGTMTSPSDNSRWQSTFMAILKGGQLYMGNQLQYGTYKQSETGYLSFTSPSRPAAAPAQPTNAAVSSIRSPRSAAGKHISQFERAGYCDLLIDKAGRYHVVYQESPANGKAVYIYYSSSANGGSSWSKPVNISNDGTGNGAGNPRILQDGSGTLYAIWKRYGNTADQYPVGEAMLDGPGGGEMGTVFYSALNGRAWSQPIQLNETQQTQDTWFATVTPQGQVAVFWAQLGPSAALKYYYYCDYLRATFLTGTTHSAISDLTKPWAPTQQYEQMPRIGYINLQGYVEAAGKAHLVYEDQSADGVPRVSYYNGQTLTIAYTYPKYQSRNTFMNPPKLMVDERGVDHLILLPPTNVVESEQVWDINLATNQRTIIFNFQDSGSSIRYFQASQGPNGRIAVMVEANPKSLANVEAYGCFYQNGAWQFRGLTNNASKNDFKSTDVRTYDGFIGYFASLTEYKTEFASVAWDAAGRKCMAMKLTAQWTGNGGLSSDSPSIIYVPID